MRARLDMALVGQGLATSREQAKRLILAGAVRVNGQVAAKPSDQVAPEAVLTVTASERFVSRGGHKLEAAIVTFAIDCCGRVALDVGASTGGFTDCLLQHGAARVHAVDVGKGQLDYRLRIDPRVIVHDELNARRLSLADLGEVVELATVDVSFISLTKILPAMVDLLKPGGTLVALIKPQFEAGRQHVRKGGVVRDPAVHDQVKTTIHKLLAETLGLRVLGVILSPLLGPAGNQEFLIAAHRP